MPVAAALLRLRGRGVARRRLRAGRRAYRDSCRAVSDAPAATVSPRVIGAQPWRPPSEVLAVVSGGGAVLIDSLTAEDFERERDRPLARPGRIPGSLQRAGGWTCSPADGTFPLPGRAARALRGRAGPARAARSPTAAAASPRPATRSRCTCSASRRRDLRRLAAGVDRGRVAAALRSELARVGCRLAVRAADILSA